MKVVMTLESMNVFIPDDVSNPFFPGTPNSKVGLEVPIELFAEYIALADRFGRMNAVMEELYRKQTGMSYMTEVDSQLPTQVLQLKDPA